MSRVRFRFGQVDATDRSLPRMELIAQELEDLGTVGESGNRKSARDVRVGNDYVYFRFVKEVPRDVSVFDEEDEIIEAKQFIARSMRFLLLDNGNYAFASRRGVSDVDALNHIFRSFDTEYEYDRYEEFDLEQMRWFYKNREKVRKVKLDEIGDHEPNPSWPDDDIVDMVEETGVEADNSIFSVGHQNNNLKKVDMIEGFVALSFLTFVRARDADENIQELLDSGRFGFNYSIDEEEVEDKEEEESRIIRDTAIGVLRNLFGDD